MATDRDRARSDVGWELYRTLLAVVQEGSLSGAARSLGITQPTVGRHVDALEKSLAVALFSRSPSGLQPTDAALLLVPHAESMARAAEALIRAASGDAHDERGTVRVTASEQIGIELVTPLLAPFYEAHPHIALELTLTSRTEDLLRREADIAVRLFRPTQGALIARRLGRLDYGLFAHPRYLAKHPAPATYRELHEHRLVGFDSEQLVRRAQDSRHRRAPITREAHAFRCDSYAGQQAALVAGLGIGMTPFALAKRDGLARIFPGEDPTTREAWLVMHEGLRMTRRVRLLYDFLADRLGAALRGKPAKKSALEPTTKRAR